MTIKEALLSLVDFQIPDLRVQKALSDISLDGEMVYVSADHEMDVDLAMAGLLYNYIGAKKVTEGDWSVEMPSRADLMSLCSSLWLKWGKPDLFAVKGPTVTQKRIW